jgi:hypothetical protein
LDQRSKTFVALCTVAVRPLGASGAPAGRVTVVALTGVE